MANENVIDFDELNELAAGAKRDGQYVYMTPGELEELIRLAKIGKAAEQKS